MAQTKILLLSIFIATFTCGDARGPIKIQKGEDASISDFPYQVSLQNSNGAHFCGGTIILPKYILTAAHCIVDDALNSTKGTILVVVGTFDKFDRSPKNVFFVVRRFYHADFSPLSSSENDIALLKLNRKIPFSNFQRLANLPMQDVPPNANVIATGWGATTYDEVSKEPRDFSQYLQKIEGTVLEQMQCQELMDNRTIYPGEFCVKQQVGAGTCAGDSGGPLTYNGQVVGVISWSHECGLGYPLVCTRVHHYIPWIAEVVSFSNRGIHSATAPAKFQEVQPIN